MKVEEIVIQRIIKGLDEGKSWLQTWTSGNPKNGLTGYEYSGINRLLLCGYEIPRFYTFNQVNQLGKSINKGASSHIVIFWKLLDDKNDPDGKIPLLRYYKVFNEADTNIEPIPTDTVDAIAVCDELVESYKDKPVIEHGEPAYYHQRDKITMPSINEFDNSESYYSTFFHELSHSTGHKDRLDRLSRTYFGSNDYALEELIAELSACFLSARAGIENKVKNNSQAYINNWIKRFNEKPKLIISLASQAEKAYRYILGESLTSEPEVV